MIPNWIHTFTKEELKNTCRAKSDDGMIEIDPDRHNGVVLSHRNSIPKYVVKSLSSTPQENREFSAIYLFSTT